MNDDFLVSFDKEETLTEKEKNDELNKN